jgi:hypothetical protein
MKVETSPDLQKIRGTSSFFFFLFVFFPLFFDFNASALFVSSILLTTATVGKMRWAVEQFEYYFDVEFIDFKIAPAN